MKTSLRLYYNLVEAKVFGSIRQQSGRSLMIAGGVGLLLGIASKAAVNWLKGATETSSAPRDSRQPDYRVMVW